MAALSESLDLLELLDGMTDDTVNQLVSELEPGETTGFGDSEALDILSICDGTSAVREGASSLNKLIQESVGDSSQKSSNFEGQADIVNFPTTFLATPIVLSVPAEPSPIRLQVQLQMPMANETQKLQDEDKYRKRSSRRQFTSEQKEQLNALFNKSMYPNKWSLAQLSSTMDIPVPTLRTWFQNRRWRMRKNIGISGSSTVRGSRTMLPDKAIDLSLPLAGQQKVLSSANNVASVFRAKTSRKKDPTKKTRSKDEKTLASVVQSHSPASTSDSHSSACNLVDTNLCSKPLAADQGHALHSNLSAPRCASSWNMTSSLCWPNNQQRLPVCPYPLLPWPVCSVPVLPLPQDCEKKFIAPSLVSSNYPALFFPPSSIYQPLYLLGLDGNICNSNQFATQNVLGKFFQGATTVPQFPLHSMPAAATPNQKCMWNTCFDSLAISSLSPWLKHCSVSNSSSVAQNRFQVSPPIYQVSTTDNANFTTATASTFGSSEIIEESASDKTSMPFCHTSSGSQSCIEIDLKPASQPCEFEKSSESCHSSSDSFQNAIRVPEEISDQQCWLTNTSSTSSASNDGNSDFAFCDSCALAKEDRCLHKEPKCLSVLPSIESKD